MFVSFTVDKADRSWHSLQIFT